MKAILLSILIVLSFTAHAGRFADAIGAYLADQNGQCRVTELSGKKFPDTNISGVCIPITTMLELDEEKQSLVLLAITELKNPEYLEAMVKM